MPPLPTPYTVLVYRPQRSPDTYGGSDVELQAVGAYPCWVRQLSAVETVDLGFQGTTVIKRFYFNGKPDIQTDDRLEWESARYRVIRVNDISSLTVLTQIDGLLED